MNLRTVVLFSIFGALCFGQSAREAEVAKAHQEFQKSWSDFDATKLERLFADDLIWVGFTGKVQDKTDIVAAFKRRTLTRPQREEQTRIRMYGDTGIVTELLNSQEADPSIVRKINMTEVWAKQKGEWKLVSFHSSLVPEPRR